MRRIVTIIFCLLFLLGCQAKQPEDRYRQGYDAGYADGYRKAQEEFGMDSRANLGAALITPRPSSSPKSSTAPADDFTVYVSRSGTMHLKENCSGMTHSTAMPYSVASQYYDKKCGNCFKKMP